MKQDYNRAPIERKEGKQMSYTYEFGSNVAQIYTSLCNKCGHEIELSAQKNNSPEYYAEVHVKCLCGGSAHFEIPVN